MAARRKRRASKATEVEVHNRVTRVVELICEGRDRKQIHCIFNDDYGLATGTVDAYLKRAREAIRAENAPRRREAVADSIAIKRHLYQKAHDAEDWALCLKISQAIDKLRGIDTRRTVVDLIRVMEAEAKAAGRHLASTHPPAAPEEPAEERADVGADDTPSPAEAGDAITDAAKRDPATILRLLATGS
jgi:DNA-directed RNA polymerase specialized sigma24 family protein